MRANSLCLFSFLLLTGCAGLPAHTFNPKGTAITSIAVAMPQHDNELLLRYRQDQLESIDLFTPLPVAKVFAYVAKENRETGFTREFGSTPTSYADELQQQILHVLGEAGIDVIAASVADSESLRRDRHGLLHTIPATAFTGTQALLETVGEIGFTAAGRGKPFQPTLWLTVRLTAANGDILLQDRILFNPDGNNDRGILLYPSADMKFDNRQAILDGSGTDIALATAISEVSNEVVFLVRGPVYVVD